VCVVSKEPVIAVIDDDDSFRASLAELLLSMAYGVRAFASAEEFVAVNDVDAYDCIITDVHMPGMSGIDLKRLLMSRDLRLPVIMVTGRADPDLESRVVSSGAICLLRKPFGADVLIGCLERVLKV
jgi:FixJ family two-component response regulator